MRKFTVYSLILVMLYIFSYADENRILILPFNSAKSNHKYAVDLMNQIKYSCSGKINCVAPSDADASKIWYPDVSGKATVTQLKVYQSLTKSSNCTHLLLGKITQDKNTARIEAFLYDLATNSIVYRTYENAENLSTISVKAQSITQRILLVVTNVMPKITDFIAAQGAVKKDIALNWKCASGCDNYTVYRSEKKNGPYARIATENDTNYRDTNAEEGIKYYYKVIPEKNGVEGEPLFTWGYVKPGNPKSLTVDDLVDSKTKSRPVLSDPAEIVKYKRHMKLMEEYYDGYFMTSFIFLVAKMYINNGDLIAYRDFTHYTLDRKNKTVYLNKQGLTVKFYSDRFFRFVRDMGWQSISEEDILPRIIHNGVAYCIRTGEVENTGPDGITRFIPTYVAAGFSTEYYKDYQNWKSNTIIFASSDKEIDKKIKEANKKGY